MSEQSARLYERVNHVVAVARWNEFVTLLKVTIVVNVASFSLACVIRNIVTIGHFSIKFLYY